MPDPCPTCHAVRAALDAAPDDPGEYMEARGWRNIVRGGRDTGWWIDPLIPDQQRAFDGAIEEQRRRDALVLAGVRLGMERAAEIVEADSPIHSSDCCARRHAREIRQALDAEPERIVITREQAIEAAAVAWRAVRRATGGVEVPHMTGARWWVRLFLDGALDPERPGDDVALAVLRALGVTR